MNRILILAACAIAVAASPADAGKKKKKSKIDYAVTLPVAPPPPLAPNGAIFQASAGYAPLTSGNRAARVGDLVTIVLVERTQATKSATQTTDRNGSISLSPPTTGPLALFSPSDVGMGGGNAFTGKGQATQANALSGEITVTVAQVMPNGAMLVKGEKLVTLNRGDEFIQIAGLIRPEDITADNRVASTRVADATITYSGNGEVARASRQGWLQRFFTMISPF
jgi:flagellar L-ring protein precursor FlgH